MWLYNEDHGLKFVVMSDVMNCYRDLGFDMGPDTLEGLGLFMLTFDQGNDEDGIHDSLLRQGRRHGVDRSSGKTAVPGK